MTIAALAGEIAAIASSGRADAADDALALLADAYFLQTAGLWTLGLALLHYRAGFGVPDERPIPEEAWGPELTAALRGGRAAALAEAPAAWRQAARPHLIVPILDASGTAHGVLIATTASSEMPEQLVAHAAALVPLLRFTEGSPRRIADDLEREVASSLWAALLAVQDHDDPAARRATAALQAALADVRAMVTTLRDRLPRVATLVEAAERYGEAYGLAVEHDGFPGEEGIAPADRAALIAIIRESLGNAAVHGRARRARLQAGRTDDGRLVLIVEDDGGHAGEPDTAPARGALGLAAVEGHALARGGTLALSRSDLGGLRLEVALPA